MSKVKKGAFFVEFFMSKIDKQNNSVRYGRIFCLDPW